MESYRFLQGCCEHYSHPSEHTSLTSKSILSFNLAVTCMHKCLGIKPWSVCWRRVGGRGGKYACISTRRAWSCNSTHMSNPYSCGKPIWCQWDYLYLKYEWDLWYCIFIAQQLFFWGFFPSLFSSSFKFWTRSTVWWNNYFPLTSLVTFFFFLSCKNFLILNAF